MENNQKVNDAVRRLQEILIQENINPQDGLPEDLFLFASTLMPFTNVDLFMHDEGKILLA